MNHKANTKLANIRIKVYSVNFAHTTLFRLNYVFIDSHVSHVFFGILVIAIT